MKTTAEQFIDGGRSAMRTMRRLCIIALSGVSVLAACGREVTAPTTLRLVTVPVDGIFSTGGANSPYVYGTFAVAGTPVSVVLGVMDQNSRLVPGVTISWTILHDGGFTDVRSSVTDSSGTAGVSWTLDTIAKLDSMVASIPSGASFVVTAAVRHAAPIPAMLVSGDAQTIAIGTTSQPLVVRVTDRYGNPIVSQAVAWSGARGGMLSALTTMTDATGTASVTLTSGAAPGVYHVVATFGTIPATTFTLTAR
jgi:hypothetical protein